MFVLVVDPLNVQGRQDNDIGFGAFGLWSIVITVLFSTAVMRLFAVPSVFVVDEVLFVRNPIRQWAIPIRLIEDTDDKLTYLRVHAAGRKIVCLGLEKTNLGLVVGSRKMDARLEQLVVASQEIVGANPQRPRDPAGTEEVRWDWVPIQRSEIVLLALWIGYVCVGAIRQFTH